MAMNNLVNMNAGKLEDIKYDVPINQEMLQLAKSLVRIPSINTTEGERNIGLYLEEYFRGIPYFQKHPELVIIQELKDDVLNRRNVFAVLLGEKAIEADEKRKTLILHGHTDTVGLEGFGALTPFACEPDRLQEELGRMNLAEEVETDLLSGDYMFGRGACDMKSGDAVFMEIIKAYSEHPETLSGNMIVSLNPVEENLHTGIIEGLAVLEELKEKYNMEYIVAINNDYICPLFKGDTVKTIYTGIVGKLLPCFYIQGKETHVGQCFDGFDASMIATGLLQKINLSRDFTDNYQGEITYPPSVLKVKDLKPWYNVQTASEAFLYFNYFVHNGSIEEITGKLQGAAREVLQEVRMKINQERAWFSEHSGQEYKANEDVLASITYEELLALVSEKYEMEVVHKELEAVLQEEVANGVDKREIPIAMIRYLLRKADITTPTVVLYYAAPYCPHNTLQEEDRELMEIVQKMAESVTAETGEVYRMMKFFPSLSDSSYLRIDDATESVQLLLNNFPGFETLYPIPIEQIQRLNVPTINYGCYGKDAHKWTERVHIPYTFGVLPKLITKTLDYYLR